jgi:mRNA interferase RelE/StbE
MPYVLLYHPEVLSEDLRSIPANIKDRIRRAIETRLAVDPIAAGRYLRRQFKGYRKLRVGDWRVVYRICGEDVMILMIGNRRDVYAELFKRISPR